MSAAAALDGAAQPPAMRHPENVRGAPTPEKLRLLAEQAPAALSASRIQQAFALADAGQALAAFSAGTSGRSS